MILKQYYLACLSQASYLVGDERSRAAVVVDPRRDVEQYLEDARNLGLEIGHVVLTHFHADFVSGHLELVERTGCRLHLGRAARADYAFEPLADGDELVLGDVRLEVLETPGHTPESISLVVRGSEGAEPHAVLTGDTLFIGDVGRPDLLVSAGRSAEEMAGLLFDSLRGKLATLPDETLVYPGHGAGSACGKNMSKETYATLGSQRAANWALGDVSREDFVRELASCQSSAPGYFSWDADYNRRQRPTLDDVLARSREGLSMEQALRKVDAGATLLDVRNPDDYAVGHLSGSVNAGLGGRFASWVGTVVPRESELVVLADPGHEDEALTRLARIGYDRVVGVVVAGGAALADCPERVARHERIDVDTLAARLREERRPLILDVRAPSEWETGHIAGSLNLPLDQLEARLAEVPRGREVVVQCQGGYRSSIAASLLERNGLPVRSDLIGGFNAWKHAGQPVALPALSTGAS